MLKGYFGFKNFSKFYMLLGIIFSVYFYGSVFLLENIIFIFKYIGI